MKVRTASLRKLWQRHKARILCISILFLVAGGLAPWAMRLSDLPDASSFQHLSPAQRRALDRAAKNAKELSWPMPKQWGRDTAGLYCNQGPVAAEEPRFQRFGE